MQGVAPVVFADGFDPLWLVISKIFKLVAAAVGLGKAANRLSNLAAVQRLAFGGGYCPKAFGGRRELE